METNSSNNFSTHLNGIVTPIYACRGMKIYAIPENELMMISSSNTLSTVFFSVGAFFLSTAITLFLSGIYANNLKYNNAGNLLFYYGTPTSFIISIIFLIIGFYMICRKNFVINTIKNESIVQNMDNYIK